MMKREPDDDDDDDSFNMDVDGDDDNDNEEEHEFVAATVQSMVQRSFREYLHQYYFYCTIY